jgi:hypothetical protein
MNGTTTTTTALVPLRVVRSKVIEAESVPSLEGALNNWFREAGDRRVFLSAFQMATLSIMILYADG